VFKKKLTSKEEKALEKGYKKKKTEIVLYREFQLGDIAYLFISDPSDVPKSDLPWSKISEDMVSKHLSILENFEQSRKIPGEIQELHRL
jgi:hypothetical protein